MRNSWNAGMVLIMSRVSQIETKKEIKIFIALWACVMALPHCYPLWATANPLIQHKEHALTQQVGKLRHFRQL